MPITLHEVRSEIKKEANGYGRGENLSVEHSGNQLESCTLSNIGTYKCTHTGDDVLHTSTLTTLRYHIVRLPVVKETCCEPRVARHPSSNCPLDFSTSVLYHNTSKFNKRFYSCIMVLSQADIDDSCRWSSGWRLLSSSHSHTLYNTALALATTAVSSQ